jgi:rhamnulokinase
MSSLKLRTEKITMEVIYRFDNYPLLKSGAYVWDIETLVQHLLEGLKEAKRLGKVPQAIGIDTFGVDYVLLDHDAKILGEVYAYRDHRNFAAREGFRQLLNETEQYRITGIQPLVFNTIYQLYADRQTGKLGKADKIMLLPCYLGYVLSGVFHNEYTIASTTGLLEARKYNWDPRLLGMLGIKEKHWGLLVYPGEVIGRLRPEIIKHIGYDASLIAVSSHDTASAVTGSLANKDTAFLSSGTWSLIGVLEDKAILSEAARLNGFTNEGNYGKKIRFPKISWDYGWFRKPAAKPGMLTPMRKSSNSLKNHKVIQGVVDVNHEDFLSPESMRRTINDKLKENGYPLPKTEGELYYSLFHSLALAYADALIKIEHLTGRKINYINIGGGGSQNRLLNRLTEKHCGRPVIVGPFEATALGNVLIQMLALGKLKDISEAREYVKKAIEAEQKTT